MMEGHQTLALQLNHCLLSPAFRSLVCRTDAREDGVESCRILLTGAEGQSRAQRQHVAHRQINQYQTYPGGEERLSCSSQSTSL